MSEMWIQKVVQDCASFGILMELIYCIFALIILLNMIQMYYLINMLFAQCFFFMKSTYIQVLLEKHCLKLE